MNRARPTRGLQPPASGLAARVLLPALAALAACPAPPSLTRDMPPDWAESLALCEPLEGEERDACALASVSLSGGNGKKLYALCERFETRDGYDRCIEMSMRHPVEPPAAGMCQRIKTEQLRDSCWMYAAEESFTYDIHTAMTACEKAGSFADRCLVTLVGVRGPVWANEGAPLMMSELEMLLTTHQGLANDRAFGSAVGLAARNVWVPAGSPSTCNFLPPGPARLACESGGVAAAY